MGKVFGAMVARDADARVIRTNARLESIAAALIDVVGARVDGGGEVRRES